MRRAIFSTLLTLDSSQSSLILFTIIMAFLHSTSFIINFSSIFSLLKCYIWRSFEARLSLILTRFSLRRALKYLFEMRKSFASYAKSKLYLKWSMLGFSSSQLKISFSLSIELVFRMRLWSLIHFWIMIERFSNSSACGLAFWDRQ